jgi:type II secretory pathway pseudopilin PulG
MLTATPPAGSSGTPRRRAGFTLAEGLITMVILGVVGLAFTKTIATQSRFFDRQTNLRTTRTVARSAMTVMLSDLRMVQDSGGVDSASSDGKTIRVLVPYRFGLYCGNTGGVSTVSMLPIDSAVVQQTKYAGYAWRNNVTGRWTVVAPADPQGTDIFVQSGNASRCTGTGAGQAAVRTVSVAGRPGAVVDITPQITDPLALQGTTAVFFYQRITYRFAASTSYPGSIALFRSVQGGTSEELMAPFDTSARFRFYTAASDNSVVTPPALSQIRGVDLVLNTISTRAVSGRTDPVKSFVTTAVFFKNTRGM